LVVILREVEEIPRRWTTKAGLKAEAVEEEKHNAARAVIRMIREEKVVLSRKKLGQGIFVSE
jgi:hypothetical protein